MALVLADRVKETTTTAGTGTVTLLGASTGYQSFAAVGNGNTTYYTIAGQTTSEWEVGVGTYTSSGTTLSRDTVLASSNSGSLVTFSAGTKDVFVTYPAEKSINVDGSGNVQLAAYNATNYASTFGSVTTKAVQFQTLGSDTNIALTLQSKGTGAIDLAAGSSGVNISNGGTVTAITRTSGGTGYTSFPSVAITAPTTAGGVQATASVTVAFNNAATVASGGTGYTVGDTLTMVGGTPTSTAGIFTVSAVSSGVVTAVTSATSKAYTVLPSNPVSTTGGTGTGCTLNVSYSIDPGGISITNAGSGYVEQPTVSFSGGGGSGASAYASVGGVTTVKAIGAGSTTISNASMVFNTPNGTALTLRDTGGADTGVLVSPAAGYVQFLALGATNSHLMLASAGTNSIYFNTQGTSQTNQMRVSHTASAVNYVHVTGAATTAKPLISAQGSDTNIDLNLQPKGSGLINIVGASRLGNNLANYFVATGGATTVAPSLASSGSDTNIDLALTPKGTGFVRGNGSAVTSENGIFVNKATVGASMTIASGYNGQSVGPMTIASGQSVTVASGQRWLVL